MKLRSVFLGILAAVIGVVLLALYMKRYEEEASGGSKIELLVAVAPIQRGKPITAELLGTRQVPQAYVDDRAIRAADKDKILNLRAAANVPSLQTLAWTDLIATTDDQRDLSALVQPGNRAMPIKVQFEDAMQLVRPGDFVDILGVFGESREASVLLQRVLVLAAGLETAVERVTDKKPVARANVLTVSVNLQEAQLLALAQAAGKLTVVVRNPEDQRVMDTPPNVESAALFDVQKRAAIQSSRRHAPVRLQAENPE